MKLNDDEIPFHNCLITNNHVIDQNDINMEKEIELVCKNIPKSFILSKQRKIFTDKVLDYTCIEILEEDGIKNYFNIDPNIIGNKIDIFEKQDILILQFPEGKDLSFSVGKIVSILNNKLFNKRRCIWLSYNF